MEKNIVSPDMNKKPNDIAAHVEEVNLFDYYAVIHKYRWMITSICITAILLSVIISMKMPPIYSATATIMPPQQEKRLPGGLAAQMGGLASFAGGMFDGCAEIYIEMLKSRTLMDNIISQFDLKKVYRTKLMDKARKRLKASTVINKAKSSVISITVEDKDPVRAADIANAYVAELDKLNRKINISEAGKQRIFLEKRLAETKENLSKAENNLKSFQGNKNIVALDAQAKVAIEAAAQIKGQIVAAEIELKGLKGFVSNNENQVIKLKQKVAELNNQLINIEKNMGKAEGKNSNFYLPFNQIPALELEFARLTREVKTQEVVFELLTQQYEMAKISEAKDTSTIQVLDKAEPPEERAKPDKRGIVTLTAIITFFMSIFLAFVIDYFKKFKSENKARWKALSSTA